MSEAEKYQGKLYVDTNKVCVVVTLTMAPAVPMRSDACLQGKKNTKDSFVLRIETAMTLPSVPRPIVAHLQVRSGPVCVQYEKGC